MKIKLIFITAAIICTILTIIISAVVIHDTFLTSALIGIAAALIYILVVHKSKFTTPRILICDLDGTIIKTLSGKTFPEDCNDWQFRTEVIEAIRNYAPTAIHIISNQGGIEKGFVQEEEFLNKMITITNQMKADFGIPVTFDYCQTNNPYDAYRKPNPGKITTYLFYKSASESDCLRIGDATGLPGQFSDSDLRCAQNAGVMYQDVDDFIRQYNPRT